MSSKPNTKKPQTKKVATRPQTDNLQAIHDATISQEVVGGKVKLLGMELRPITLESIVLLKQINSPLILGKPIAEIPNVFLDCCKFIVLQSADRKEARRFAWDEEALTDAALDVAADIPALHFNDVTDSVNALLVDATSTAVEAKPRDGEKPSNPLGN